MISMISLDQPVTTTHYFLSWKNNALWLRGHSSRLFISPFTAKFFERTVFNYCSTHEWDFSNNNSNNSSIFHMPHTVIKNLSVWLTHLILTQTYRISTIIIPILQFLLYLTLHQPTGKKQIRVSGLSMGNKDRNKKRATSCWPGPLAARGKRYTHFTPLIRVISRSPFSYLFIALICPLTTLLPKSPMTFLFPIQWKNFIPHFLESRRSFTSSCHSTWSSPLLLWPVPPDLLCRFILLLWSSLTWPCSAGSILGPQPCVPMSHHRVTAGAIFIWINIYKQLSLKLDLSSPGLILLVMPLAC